MSADTFEFDQGDREVLRGTLHDPAATTGDVLTVQAGGAIAAAPGGVATVQANYASTAVAVADGAFDQLPWENLVSGTELLDRTDPLNPLFLAAGTYAVQVAVQTTALFTVGGNAQVVITAGPVNADAMFSNCGANVSAGGPTVITQVQAGDPLTVYVLNGDGAASRDFALSSASIVKLA